MGELVEGLMAVIGIVAGMMVALSTRAIGNIATAGERDKWHHYPRIIRLQREQMAA